MCAAKVVSLRELGGRDEAVATRRDQCDGLHNNIVDMFTCIYHFLLLFEMSSRIGWLVVQVNMIKK